MPNMKLTVDRREPQNVIDLLRHHGFNVDVTTQKLGDICSDHCIVERKGFNDFVSSVIDTRVFSQSKRMMYSDKPAFLLLHGVWDIRRRVTDKQVAGAIASLMVRNANPTLVMLCDKENEWKYFSMAMYISGKICEKVEQGKFLHPKSFKKWKKPKVPRKVDKVARLFGVPHVVAARMLVKFKSVRGICNAKLSDLLDVQGIGDVRAREIQQLVT